MYLADTGPSVVIPLSNTAPGQCPDGSPSKSDYAGECVFYPNSNRTSISTNCAGFLQTLGPGDLRADKRCKRSRIYVLPLAGPPQQPVANPAYDPAAAAPSTPVTRYGLWDAVKDSIGLRVEEIGAQGNNLVKYAAVSLAAIGAALLLMRN